VRALLRGGPRAERLADREDIVVDRLRQTDYAHLVALLGQEGREVGGRHVSVVATDGVQHLYLILDQLVRRDALRVLPIFDKASLDAVLQVGQLDARVANRRAAVARTSGVTRTELPRSRPWYPLM